MSGEMSTSNGIALYTVKLNIVSARENCQSILPKSFKYVVGFFKEHISWKQIAYKCCLKIV